MLPDDEGIDEAVGPEDLEGEIDLDEDDEEPALPVAAGDDEDESDDASLEELLSQRSATRRAGEDAEEDEDIMALASEREAPIAEPLPTRVVPIKDRQEFVCNHCHLVKAKSQLADEARMLCRDCV